MMYSKFSPKQLYAMLWWAKRGNLFDALICDGSVRSGKTMSMTIGFVLWSCRTFSGEIFALCGKTIASLRRNVITPMRKWLEGVAVISENLSQNYIEVSMEGKANRYYLFGGKDESSAALIQGMTLAGVLFDEVALMPRSFVEQALARCSVKGAKFWFNCNPESPLHWFYTNWIQKYDEKRALYLHFTMDDNYSLPDEVRERYERMYSGIFYERFIRGHWVIAEGLVYPMFSKAHIGIPAGLNGDWFISIDYGTMNPTSMGLWCRTYDGHAYRVKESYYDGRQLGIPRTDEEHYAALCALADGYDIQEVIVDPSAASFIECIYRHGQFRVVKADNKVDDGIQDTATLLGCGRLHFSPDCKDILREFGLYRYDTQKTEGGDHVIKANDHAMDDMRYFVRLEMWRVLQEVRQS